MPNLLRALIRPALVCLCSACLCADAQDWPVFRHDAQLTGRAALAADIAQPRVVSQHFVGAWEGWLTLKAEPGAAADLRTNPATGDLTAARGAFGLTPPRYGLREGAEPVPLPDTTGRVAGKILPGVPGLQVVEFDNAFRYSGDDYGHLWAYDTEPRREVWRTPAEPNMFMPLTLLLDADGDGDPEIVVATHYRVMVFDARTGHKDAEIRIHSYRNYGFFGARDLDADGLPEYVIVSDFSSHLDVVDYEGGELKLLWRRDIDPDLESRSKSVRVGPEPIQDVDGDGRFEVLVNLFNETGDKQWHVMGFDALDGRLTVDLPRRFLAGCADLEGGKPPLLLTTDTEGLPLPKWGTLRVSRVAAGQAQDLWETQRARWQTWDLPGFPEHTQTGATLGRQTCLVDEAAAMLYVLRPADDGRQSLCALQWSGGAARELWRATGPGLEAAASRDTDGDGSPEVLARMLAPKAETALALSGVGGSLIAMQSRGARPTSPVCADVDLDGAPEVLVNDGTGQILCLRAQPDTRAFSEVWRVPGRSMADSEAQWYGVQTGDVDADGAPEVLIGSSTDNGQAVLRALDGSGRVEWECVFAHIDGSDPIWNRGCLTYWAVLRAPDGPRVYASVRRGAMHSDESYLLRGSDGTVVWGQDKIKCPHANRAPGGKMVASGDVNGDGHDDIIITYPDVVMVLSGTTGEPLMTHPTTGSDLPGWTAYAVPVLTDADGDGTVEIYWTASTYTLAAFDLTGKVLWHTGYRDGKYVQGCWALPAVGDFIPGGSLEILSGGFDDGLRAYEASGGKLLGRLDAPAPTGPALSVDLDADGVEEAVVPATDGLRAISLKSGEPQVLWHLPLPAVASAPIVADLDGDGKGEIAVVCADGYLRIIDGQ